MKLSRIILLVSAITLLVLPVLQTQAADAPASYYELRLYSVTSNKMDGVLERFHETVEVIQKSISEFHQDADWQRVEKETERDGKLRSGVEAFKLRPADFSVIK